MKRIWRNWNPRAFLMGMKNAETTVKNSSSKYLTWTYHMIQQFHSQVYIQEKWKHAHIKTCTKMFIATLSITAKSENSPMSINWWMGKHNVTYPYTGILFNHKVLIGTTRMCFENVMLSERKKMQGHILCGFIYVKCPE